MWFSDAQAQTAETFARVVYSGAAFGLLAWAVHQVAG